MQTSQHDNNNNSWCQECQWWTAHSELWRASGRFVIMAQFNRAGASPGAFNFSEPALVTSSRPPVCAVSHGWLERHRRTRALRSVRTRARVCYLKGSRHARRDQLDNGAVTRWREQRSQTRPSRGDQRRTERRRSPACCTATARVCSSSTWVRLPLFTRRWRHSCCHSVIITAMILRFFLL